VKQLALALVTLGSVLFGSAQLEAQPTLGEVYTLTNQTSGNSVLVFRRSVGGSLSLLGSFPTGGIGVGTGVDPLGSQGAVVLDKSGRFLFAVNAGSNDISTFAVDGERLDLINTVKSGGIMPVSIAVYGSLIYVLNAGGTPNVAGFTIDHRTDELVPLPGSQRGLAGGAAAVPAEVSFNASGDILMVTEKGTQTIDTFSVNGDGSLTGPVAHLASGGTPFGFQFTHRNLAIVSEAGPNALSSYRAGETGNLDLITASLANGQAAVCWVAVTEDDHFAYTINAGTGTISSYSISTDGTLSLLNAVAASTGAGSAPTDPGSLREARSFMSGSLG
jgi:6-phosphogluconolactonase